MDPLILNGQLSLAQLANQYHALQPVSLAPVSREKVIAAQQMVMDCVNENNIVYGINTGFGKLATKVIPGKKLQSLQKNLILSHAAGTGPLLSAKVVRLVYLLKINTLLQGYSGIRWEVIETLVQLYNAEVTPCIPAKGSVGASGDLAPLAHFACPLLGVGEVFFQGKKMPSRQMLKQLGLKPLILAPKEGLALLNGTQVSSALLLEAFFRCEQLLAAAIAAGALSLEAAQADLQPFDARIHAVRQSSSQIEVASIFRQWLAKSEWRQSYQNNRVQDPYSLRCQPQVLGACLGQLRYVQEILTTEINAVTDNPLVFAKEKEILSGGNFHAQALAFGADALANAIATIGNIAERRIALLIDPNFSGLPPFLVEHSGLNSGFMVAQVTAAALASENKVLAHPASVDSIPTSANQEDHVSMATFAARRLGEMIENTATIIAIELLAACQGIDFRQPELIAPRLKKIYQIIRQQVPFYKQDRYFHPDIMAVKRMVESGKLL